jgi:NTE family protein
MRNRGKGRAAVALLVGLAIALGLPGSGAAEKPSKRDPKRDARPRLGLVLSGGGARGAAHLGVLQVLEEMRIPVDMVTGTSMGSIVGGLYAAGLSPDEVSAVIQSVDWVRVFEDKPDRQDLSFRRKQDDRNFLTNLRLAFKDWSVFIPSGIVEGQKLDFLLRSMTLDQNGIAQIENLPLPFRAVATDIATGEEVVFDKGPLAVAQRASMSVPAAFSPVVIDKRVLVDGYVANNLPIDVAQKLGAENVIAVDISTPVAELAELQSAVGINAQVGTFPVQQQQARQIERLKKTDVLLQPDLGDLSAASFTRMAEAVEIGRQAALAAKEKLARYSVSEAEYAQWRARQRRAPVQMPMISAVRIENRSPVSDRVVRARIHTQPGAPLDLEVLSKDLGRLYGLDAFERVRFDLQREPEGMVLVYQIEARERGRQYVRFGLNLETDIGDEAIYNIGANHVWFPINSWDGEMRTELQFGDTSRVGTELYQPIEPREWLFVQPFVSFQRSDLDVFQGHDHVATYDRDETITGALVGANLGNVAQIRGGIGYLNEELGRNTGDPAVFHSRKLSGGVYDAEFEYDTLDSVRFPNDGSYANVQALWIREDLGFDDSFARVRGQVSTFRTWRKNTIGLSAKYETTINGGPHPEALHSLGGFLNLSGFDHNSLTGRHAGLAQLLIYRRIASPAVFAWEFPVYLGGMYEIGNTWDDRKDIDNDLRNSGGPFVGVDTPLGPLYLAYAHGQGGHDQVYLYLGRSF